MNGQGGIEETPTGNPTGVQEMYIKEEKKRND